ncbi:MAG: rod shape-determining protein MreC [Acidimicrobiales bacterium]|nr:rod shape-determining protein MreC [Acidimicrobiales bacterium]
MAYPRRSSRSPRSRFTLGLLLLTAVSLLVLDLPGTGPLDPVRNALSTAFRPVQAAGDAIFQPISNGWKGAFGYGDLEDENDALRRDLEEAKGQEAEVERLEAEIDELRALEGIEVPDEETKAAEVISGPLSSFEQTVQINLGSSDGVKRGMAVVTGAGVFGRVADVRATTATVELVTSSDVTIGARLEDGTLTTVTGQGQDSPLRMAPIGIEVAVEEGDLVSTSGIDRSPIPGDQTIGRVVGIEESGGGVEQVIEVEHAADLTSRFVAVVLREIPE